MRDGTLLPPVRSLPAGAAELRSQVRGFLSAERTAGRFVPACDAWLSGWDESFSRRLAERGWVGMTIPRVYGGHGRSALERYVVVEELLAAGAPVAAHWISDRQVGPNLLRYGSEPLKRRYLPPIAQGTCYFAIGLSEPDAGSDLASVRTTGARADGGWTVSGTKIWTSGAHRAHALIALLRTGPPDGRQGRAPPTPARSAGWSPGCGRAGRCRWRWPGRSPRARHPRSRRRWSRTSGRGWRARSSRWPGC